MAGYKRKNWVLSMSDMRAYSHLVKASEGLPQTFPPRVYSRKFTGGLHLPSPIATSVSCKALRATNSQQLALAVAGVGSSEGVRRSGAIDTTTFICATGFQTKLNFSKLTVIKITGE